MFRTLVTSTRTALTSTTTKAASFSTSSTPLAKSVIPSLGQLPRDIKTQFNTSLTEYHKKVEEQHRIRDEAALAANAEHDASDGQSKAPVSSSERKPSGGMVSRLLHGSAEAQEDTRQIEQSYSKVLARGKYVHEIVFHRVKPEKMDEYVALIGKEYPAIAADKSGEVKLVGSWMTEIGELDTFVHIWEYNNYDGYHETLRHFHEKSSYNNFQEKLRPLLVSRTNSLMQEFSFWPTTPPRELGGIFELRSYILHPGKLLEWEQHWRTGLAARRSQGMEGVGAYFTQVGGLNEVHYMWQYSDLKGRQDLRNRSWRAEGWADTVHRTLPLIRDMQSRIMVPLPWSPVR